MVTLWKDPNHILDTTKSPIFRNASSGRGLCYVSVSSFVMKLSTMAQ